MVRWTNQLYIGDNIGNKKDRIITSINRREATFNIYCITFASHPDNLFDIMDANELLFPYYAKKEICIVGLAKGREEAIKLVQEMLLEVYDRTGEFRVRSYFT